MNFQTYSKKWLDTVGILKKPASQASMRSHIHKMDVCFGGLELNSLTEDLIQSHIADLSSGLSAGAVRNYWGTIRLILGRAKKEHLIESVPDPVLPKKGGKPQSYLTVEELQILSRLGLLYFVLAETGCRAGEVLGLKPEDVDLKNLTLSIRRSIYAGDPQTPKTSNAFRDICISHRLGEEIQKAFAGDSYIFRTRTRKPLQQNFLLGRLKSDVAKCLPSIAPGRVVGFHSFRRGNATMLAGLGCPIKTISARHGRTTGNLTVDSYIGFEKFSDREWADKLGSLLG